MSFGEPWQLNGDLYAVDSTGSTRFKFEWVTIADWNRIAACVNALAGLDPEAVALAKTTLENVSRFLQYQMGSSYRHMQAEVDNALASLAPKTQEETNG